MNNIIKLLLAFGLLASGTVNSAIYDFDEGINGTTQLSGLTSFQGSIETQQYGSFVTEQEIESLLNNSSYSFAAYIGNSIAFTLDNSNSNWDITYGGTGSSIEVTSTANSLVIDLVTNNEISDAALVLKNDVNWDVLQIRQSNNVSDYNFFYFSDDALINRIIIDQPYDAAYVFSDVSAVPIPPAIWLFISAITFISSMRINKHA